MKNDQMKCTDTTYNIKRHGRVGPFCFSSNLHSGLLPEHTCSPANLCADVSAAAFKDAVYIRYSDFPVSQT